MKIAFLHRFLPHKEKLVQVTKSLDKKVQFEIADASRRVFLENSFDVIYSRDTILHIADKQDLLRRFHTWLKPGGKLLITDYCCGETPWSVPFEEYVRQRGYFLHTVQRYGQLLREAGFTGVRAEDRTRQFADILQRELQRIEGERAAFLQEFSEADYHYIVDGWEEKVRRCKFGDQRWGLFFAKKPAEPGSRRACGSPEETAIAESGPQTESGGRGAITPAL
uniref:phosphoethanolamine methyltransferase n=1 Tax=Pristiophorus japonicus TaxID=55135 RepID=UPI00398F1985